MPELSSTGEVVMNPWNTPLFDSEVGGFVFSDGLPDEVRAHKEGEK